MQWERVVASGAFGRTPGPACSVKIEVLPTEPASVWVDAMQLEEGDCTEYAPTQPLEAALATDRAADVFFYEIGAKATLHYSRRGIDVKRGVW